jgi:hypothetical protein
MTVTTISAWNAERRFYSGMALAMIALVLLGFGPSFYFIGYLHFPRPNPVLNPLVILHGVVFSLWMALFAVQAGLVAANRRDLHRKLGVAGFALAVLMVPVMYATSIGQIARHNQPPFTDPLNWSAVPLFIIPAFIVLVWLGWRERRNPAAHKRLMLGAALLMMDPAIGRLPLAPPVLGGFAMLNLLSWLTFLPLILWDRKTLGTMHWATRLGAGLFAITLLARLAVLATGTWAPVAAVLPGA